MCHLHTGQTFFTRSNFLGAMQGFQSTTALKSVMVKFFGCYARISKCDGFEKCDGLCEVWWSVSQRYRTDDVTYDVTSDIWCDIWHMMVCEPALPEYIYRYGGDMHPWYTYIHTYIHTCICMYVCVFIYIHALPEYIYRYGGDMHPWIDKYTRVTRLTIDI